MKAISLYLLFALFLVRPLYGDEILVAVASNFTAPINTLAQQFEAETGHEVQLAFGSSGRFYAQILNGAPFQIFLSADTEKPQLLEAAGLTVSDSRFTYATGSLVLWSSDPDMAANGPEVLDGNFRRLALANPALAPYGQAALQVLESFDKVESTRSRWVLGENIAQTFQFVDTGNAELGFVALSQVSENGAIIRGSGWVVPAQLHSPISQQAVLLTNGADCTACRAFYDFIKSVEASQVIAAYGYGTNPIETD